MAEIAKKKWGEGREIKSIGVIQGAFTDKSDLKVILIINVIFALWLTIMMTWGNIGIWSYVIILIWGIYNVRQQFD